MNLSKPNVIFLMTDHQRADSIFMIQDGKEVTPNLNKLAREASVFKRAYNTCPLCVPARTALATGISPIKNGVVFNDVKGRTAGDYKTIHQYLYEEGYEVAHVGIQHIRVKPDLRERLNFSLWIEEADYNNYAKEKGIETKRDILNTREIVEFQEGEYKNHRYSNNRATKWANDLEDFKDVYFGEKALEFINKDHEKPYALFLYLWAPHPPLIVPEPYASKFNPDNLELPDNLGIYGKGMPEGRKKGAAYQLGEGIDEKQWRKTWAAHLGLVNLADEILGRVINAAKEKDSNSLILFTSDHGEHLGQHSMYQKMEMYEQAVNVPLIIKAPQGQKRTFNTPVSHLDIVPTVLDFAGNSKREFEGVSLKRSILEGEQLEDRCIFGQYSGNPTFGDVRRMIVWKNYKYIYDGETGELYDLEKDPLEMNNIINDEQYKSLVEDMHGKLKAKNESIGDWVKY